MVDSTPNFTGFIVRRQRIMGLWFGLLILVFGVIIGAGGTFLHYKDRLIQNRGFGGPDPKRILQDMQVKLSLTEQQVKQIEELFHQRGQTWGEFQKQEQKAMFDGMKSILTAEQYNAWLEEMKQRRERWERERASHGQQGPGRGGPEGQRGQGGPDRPDGRRDKPGQNDRMQQGPPPGEPKPGGPMPGQPTPPPPGAPRPDVAPRPSEPAPPAPGSTPPTTPEESKPL